MEIIRVECEVMAVVFSSRATPFIPFFFAGRKEEMK